MKLFGLKNCDTCRKALKALAAAGRDVTFYDVRADGLGVAQVLEWASAVGWETLLNTRSTTWRELPADQKEDLDRSQGVCLMADYPTLIKRPVIEADGEVTVGWTKDVQDALLK